MDQRPIANVMWTGGLDSTYRVVQLSRENVIIQPYYFYHPNRISRDIELATIKKLTDMIRTRPDTKAELRDVIVKPVEELYPIDPDLTAAYKEVIKHEKVAPQNEWVAQATRRLPNLQISFERTEEIPDDHRVPDCVHLLPKTLVEEGPIRYYKLKPEVGKDRYTLFKDYCFPVEVAERTKQQMVDDLKAWGAFDIAENTWFCHYPRKNGEPCGFCKPCRATVAELGEWRLKGGALKRYRHWRWHLFKHRIVKATKMVLGKK